MRDTGAGQPLPAGDLGLFGDFTRVQKSSPLDGLPHEFGHPGLLRLPGQLGLAPRRRDSTDYLVGAHTARQGTDVPVFKGPLGPKGDFHRLFAVGSGTIFILQGYVDDPKTDFRLGPPWLVSSTSTLGELFLTVFDKSKTATAGDAVARSPCDGRTPN